MQEQPTILRDLPSQLIQPKCLSLRLNWVDFAFSIESLNELAASEQVSKRMQRWGLVFVQCLGTTHKDHEQDVERVLKSLLYGERLDDGLLC